MIGKKMSKKGKEYSDKEVNSMILYLRINRVAEMQYIDDSSDKFHDFISHKKLTREEVIDLALDYKWHKSWNT
tara:strand:- start:4704 stop:4922 length:219 start_codon:yes stop_codon:yes gene_type:complete